MAVCPTCGKKLATRNGKHDRTPESRAASRAAITQRWTALTQLEERKRQEGVQILTNELRGHKTRYYFSRLLQLYNLHLVRLGRQPIPMVEFDPWSAFAPKVREQFVRLAYDPDNPLAVDQARRFFGIELREGAA